MAAAGARAARARQCRVRTFFLGAYGTCVPYGADTRADCTSLRSMASARLLLSRSCCSAAKTVTGDTLIFIKVLMCIFVLVYPLLALLSVVKSPNLTTEKKE